METRPPSVRFREHVESTLERRNQTQQYHAQTVFQIISQQFAGWQKVHKRTRKLRVLQVGCSTGILAWNLAYLGKTFLTVDGIDKDPKLIETAQKKYPNMLFRTTSLTEFIMENQYDVIVCVGTIASLKSFSNLQKAIQTFRDHLNPGGILILDPGTIRESIIEEQTSNRYKLPETIISDDPDFKFLKTNTSNEVRVRSTNTGEAVTMSVQDFVTSYFTSSFYNPNSNSNNKNTPNYSPSKEQQECLYVKHYHYTIVSPKGVELLTDTEEYGLWSLSQYEDLFKGIGFCHHEFLRGLNYFIVKEQEAEREPRFNLRSSTGSSSSPTTARPRSQSPPPSFSALNSLSISPPSSGMAQSPTTSPRYRTPDKEKERLRTDHPVFCKVVCTGDWTAQLNYLVEKGWEINNLLFETESKYRELDDYGKPLQEKPGMHPNRGISWYDVKTQCVLLQYPADDALEEV